MNIFDIIAIVLFALFVIVCAFRGFLKILSKWGAFFAAMIFSKMFGARVGALIFGEIPVLSSFSKVLGTALLFVVLFLACRIIFGLLAKLITKVLKTEAIDKVLGMLVGIAGGVASVFLFAFVLEFFVSLVSIFNTDAEIVHMVNDTSILKYFMR